MVISKPEKSQIKFGMNDKIGAKKWTEKISSGKSMFMGGWVDGWMGGWVDGWVGVKAALRIAYSNKK